MGDVESERKSFDEKSLEVGGETVRVRRAELALRVVRREDNLDESVEGAILRDGIVANRGESERRRGIINK